MSMEKNYWARISISKNPATKSGCCGVIYFGTFRPKCFDSRFAQPKSFYTVKRFFALDGREGLMICRKYCEDGKAPEGYVKLCKMAGFNGASRLSFGRTETVELLNDFKGEYLEAEMCHLPDLDLPGSEAHGYVLWRDKRTGYTNVMSTTEVPVIKTATEPAPLVVEQNNDIRETAQSDSAISTIKELIMEQIEAVDKELKPLTERVKVLQATRDRLQLAANALSEEG